MEVQETSLQLLPVLEKNVNPADFRWLKDRIDKLLAEPSARQLFMTYSLLGNRISPETADFSGLKGSETLQYLQEHGADTREVCRIFLLSRVLEEAPDFYMSKVAKLIELADTSELVTFLRYLVLLPGAASFRPAAVEALRTNIATVFDAIALDNPFPALYFNDQQWNQMYLKAAFMQRDLSQIRDIDTRSNADLARIISDYAHERWAASRDVDPYFWRPVSPHLDEMLLADMKRMLASSNTKENHAAALVLHESGNPAADELLQEYPDLATAVESKELRWSTLKD